MAIAPPVETITVQASCFCPLRNMAMAVRPAAVPITACVPSCVITSMT